MVRTSSSEKIYLGGTILYVLADILKTASLFFRILAPKYEIRVKSKNLSKYEKFDFIIVGVKKCGTGALNSFLRFHPQVSIQSTFRGEGHFFDIGSRVKNRFCDFWIFAQILNFSPKFPFLGATSIFF